MLAGFMDAVNSHPHSHPQHPVGGHHTLRDAGF